MESQTFPKPSTSQNLLQLVHTGVCAGFSIQTRKESGLPRKSTRKFSLGNL